MITPFSVLFHPLHVGFPVFGYELPVDPARSSAMAAATCKQVLVTVEQVYLQTPETAVAIGLNLFFPLWVAGYSKRRSFNRLLTRMCVLLCLTLMLVINEHRIILVFKR